MKLPFFLKSLSVLALSLVASFALAQTTGAPSKDQSKAAILTRVQLDQLLAKPDQLLIIDVRRPDELSSIGGFPVYLSAQLADLEKSVAWIPKDRKIVTVSNHAARAGRAADLLASKGFNVIGHIGAQNYEEEGGKLTKIAPKAPANATAQAAAPAKAE